MSPKHIVSVLFIGTALLFGLTVQAPAASAGGFQYVVMSNGKVARIYVSGTINKSAWYNGSKGRARALVGF